jgi:soluble lytic murein transglycosylase
MKKPLRILALVLFFAADAAAMIVLLRDKDPGYRLACWLSFGRHHCFDPAISAAAERENLEPTLVKAMIWRASGFAPQKLGPSHERGLMQIGEGVGQDWAAASQAATFMQADLFNPDTNLRAGCWYFRKVLERWNDRDDPLPFALAEYAAGHQAVLAWAGPNGSAEALMSAINDAPTKAFVDDVLRRRGYYLAVQ